jgi:capsular polysaccharide biosynthesis protein
MTVSGTERAMFLSWIGEAPHKAPAGGTRLFISRQGHTSRNPGYRMLVNEQELAAHLTREGYSVYEPERDPPALQWQRFNEADQIVALGGAALYNCAFCRPGTPVVTIESSTDFVRPHSDLLSSLDLKFALVIGRQDANDPTPVHKRWFVDAAAVAKAVHSF